MRYICIQHIVHSSLHRAFSFCCCTCAISCACDDFRRREFQDLLRWPSWILLSTWQPTKINGYCLEWLKVKPTGIHLAHACEASTRTPCDISLHRVFDGEFFPSLFLSLFQHTNVKAVDAHVETVQSDEHKSLPSADICAHTAYGVLAKWMLSEMHIFLGIFTGVRRVLENGCFLGYIAYRGRLTLDVYGMLHWSKSIILCENLAGILDWCESRTIQWPAFSGVVCQQNKTINYWMANMRTSLTK